MESKIMIMIKITMSKDLARARGLNLAFNLNPPFRIEKLTPKQPQFCLVFRRADASFSGLL